MTGPLFSFLDLITLRFNSRLADEEYVHALIQLNRRVNGRNKTACRRLAKHLPDSPTKTFWLTRFGHPGYEIHHLGEISENLKGSSDIGPVDLHISPNGGCAVVVSDEWHETYFYRDKPVLSNRSLAYRDWTNRPCYAGAAADCLPQLYRQLADPVSSMRINEKVLRRIMGDEGYLRLLFETQATI